MRRFWKGRRPVATNLTPEQLKVGARYNWVGQLERLAYMGSRHYTGDSRRWHQFEKVDNPGAVWCEVLGSDLGLLEETVEPQNG